MGKIQIIDPNNNTDFKSPNVITPENLNIVVELKAIKKNRSAIAVGNGVIVKRGEEAKRIAFLDGYTFGKDKYLTTHYTELNSSFNKANKDLETLGIKDVQIEFNSANAPIITIKFTDVRGKLFEMGKDSPYSVFWELPYPIFELTVKGYYGKSVTYKLHLTNFEGDFDYSSGSYEFQCKFIGYTYAFLSDIIMGHLKGISYTKMGLAKIEQKKQKDNGKYKFVTFKELDSILEELTININKKKSEDGRIKAVMLSTEVIPSLESFKEQYLSLINFDDTLEILPPNGFFHFNGKVETKNDVDYFISLFNKNISKINKNISELIVNINKSLVDKSLNVENFLIKLNSNLIEGFNINIPKTLEEFNNKTKFNLTNEQFDNFISSLNDVPSRSGSIVFVKKNLDEIDLLINELNDNKNSTLAYLSEEILTSSETLNSFPPTIGNITNLICDHVDIFMECIKEVAYNAEKDSNRENKLKNIGGFLDKIDDNTNGFLHKIGDDKIKNLKAFPSYAALEKGVLVDKWIGTVAPELPEVKFINELLVGMIESGLQDKKTNDLLNSIENKDSWVGVNAFDSTLFNIKNPYSELKNYANVSDYLRLIMLRAFIYLGFSNRFDLININEIKTMARLEANNLYKNLINKTILQGFKNYALTSAEFSNKLIKESKESKFENFTDNFKTDKVKSSILTEINSESHTMGGGSVIGNSNTITVGGDYYDYNYIPNVNNNLLDYSKVYLPLTISDSFKDFSGDFLNVNLEDKKELKDNNVIFFTNSGNLDDGSTFIKIVDSKKDVIYSDYVSNVGGAFVENKIVDMNNNLIDGGLLNDYSKVSYGGFDELPAFLLFYSDVNNNFNTPSELKTKRNVDLNKFEIGNTNGSLPNRTDKRLIINSRRHISLLSSLAYINNDRSVLQNYSIPNLGFNIRSNEFQSLFGSDLYYSQNNIKAKAYLFLHSIPFNGVGEDGLFSNEVIKKLFNQKSAKINIPYSWCLFLGAIIGRLEGNFKVDFNNGDFSYIKDLKKNNSPLLNQYCSYESSILDKNSNFSFYGTVFSDFKNVEGIILNLPKSVKNEFSNLFNEWVINGFDSIRTEFELFNSNTTKNQRYQFWLDFKNNLTTNPNNLYTSPILNANAINNYNIFLKEPFDYNGNNLNSLLLKLKNDDYGSPFNFFLETKDGSQGVIKLFDFLNENKTLINSSWRIWDGLYNSENSPIRVKKNNLNDYLITFFDEFIKVSKEDKESIDNTKENLKLELFNSINNDDIKLNLYIKIKSIYDKWICGEEEKYVGLNNDDLYNSFKFIDRAYNNIEHDFKINLVPMITELNQNYGQTFYNYMARILSDNNFDFFPLPTFINYNDHKEVEKVFKTFNYSQVETSIGPQFICMYSGQRSNSLHDSINFKNDSFDFLADGSGTMPSLPDFSENNDTVPVFLVQYGSGDQSIFKNIKSTQSEYTATDESLNITENLINKGVSSIGQNLYDVYINRSYSTQIEMLGNAMIQPLMYFQLDNLPLFRGAYLITKVSHSITPNSMLTNFTGVRVRAVKPKMIDNTSIFLNLFNNLNGVSTEGAKLSDLLSSEDFPIENGGVRPLDKPLPLPKDKLKYIGKIL